MLLSPQSFRLKVRCCFSHFDINGAAHLRHAQVRLNGAPFYDTLCRPSSCLKHYPEHLATMAAPSPWDSRPLGDPAFTSVKRISTCRCPFVRFTHSVWATHHRGRSIRSSIPGLLPHLMVLDVGCGVIASGLLRWVSYCTV